MLSDRDYMREEDHGTRLSWTVMLLIALVVVFAADEIAKAYLGLSLQQHGALSSSVWQSGWVWQLVTFQFLHGGFPHRGGVWRPTNAGPLDGRWSGGWFVAVGD